MTAGMPVSAANTVPTRGPVIIIRRRVADLERRPISGGSIAHEKDAAQCGAVIERKIPDAGDAAAES